MTSKQRSSSIEQHTPFLPFFAEGHMFLTGYKKCMVNFDESFIPMIASFLFV